MLPAQDSQLDVQASLKRLQMADSILDCVGNTPLVRIKPQGRWPEDVVVLAKLEAFNPGGSVKDRPALSIVRGGLARGELTPGKTIIDSSSGNTGIALAMIGRALGYSVKLVMPGNVTEERKKLADAYGAKVIFSDPLLSSDGALERCREIVGADPDTYFYADQYNNPDNPRAHETTTAAEIFDQTGGEITHFVATLGTSGTLIGAGRGLRARKPGVKIISVEPAEGLHGIEGLKRMDAALVPGIYDAAFADENIEVATEDAYEWTHWLMREQGLFTGHSSGAAICGAARVARALDAGVIVTLFPDGGEKYLSVKI